MCVRDREREGECVSGWKRQNERESERESERGLGAEGAKHLGRRHVRMLLLIE